MRGKVVCPICKSEALFFSSEADGISPLEARVEREFAEARLYQHILDQHQGAAPRAPIQFKMAYAKNRKKLAAWAATEAEKPAAAAEPKPEPKRAAQPPARPAEAAHRAPAKAAPEKKPARPKVRRSAAPKPPPGAARGRSGGRGKPAPRGRAK
jgi:hypothetical protein